MPIAHSLTKVQKTIQKSKGAMHPKGRKFKQLSRATLRESKINEKKLHHVQNKEYQNQRTVFFQEAISNREEKDVFGLEDMKLFIEAFLSRDDEEIEQLKSERRKGRPATTRQVLLENKKKEEEQEYKTGYLIPDISDEKTVVFLRNWNGTTGGLGILKFIRISKDTTELPNPEDAMRD
ncbi:hypothetical protein BN7_566 [Wickerhamomyces ciferrii]|uniref:Translation machinery-associated protein 16 n=1 Tax=Wickerhamomyces ciferrii (strain ATCC 14091 / BCRC 22168 / CBS 111 / JCM 3599 / NBRC 0793 / NRRL Y-1031 F-60-10) TaxID=1206466 RepID=K0KHZ3_WICCF|nr:uncharacterized protein BN7_566 [Wickerhamomyces ciferrii]CCH41029.1 hypothetical protein BN7_566 [Wickerhamomyces ciferrii]